MNRSKRMMGVSAIAGLAAVVAGCDGDVTAYCTDKMDRVVEDRHCEKERHGSTGVFVNGGQTYRYYYGGDDAAPLKNGQRVSGGSFTVPEGRSVTTRSGIVRGGLGGGKASSGS